jgi:DNA (cytosine-5)-methyltransferase 1
VEIEAYAIANLVAKIEQGKMDAAPIWSNLKTFPAQIFRGKVHGIIGGYPCQPFSHAGQRQGTDDPRHLWPYIEEHIRTIRPVWCFFENVSGHLSLGFKEVFASLRDMGYKVEAGLFTASEVGFPHKRERLFILAYSERMYANRNTTEFQGQNEQQAEERQKKRLAKSSSAGQLAYSDGNRQKSDIRTNQSQAGNLRRGNERDVSKRYDKPCGEQKCQNQNYAQNVAKQQSKQDSQKKGKFARDVPHSYSKRPPVPVCGKLRSVPGPAEQTGGSESCGIYAETGGMYPARPGQPQHEWEEPRTVKPGMGRTVNGFRSRVDELRLLGNGVVPQTAELAFRTLWNRTLGQR